MPYKRQTHARYEELVPVWEKMEAVLSGEAAAKGYDKDLRRDNTNLLVPFSVNMERDQWALYLHEAELPGIAEQFARTVRGGMLRKPVVIEPADDSPNTLEPWLRTRPGAGGEDLLAFLTAALWEEIKTSRAWIYVNHPGMNGVEEPDGGPPAPYMELVKARELLDWRTGMHPNTGQNALLSATVSKVVRIENDGSGNPQFVDRVWVHDLDAEGYYRLRIYEKRRSRTIDAMDPNRRRRNSFVYQILDFGSYDLVDEQTNITDADGARLREIPLFPLNGLYDPLQPVFETFCNREIHLYNKQSRKNHLLYGTATYTLVAKTDDDDVISRLQSAGLGSILQIGQNDDLDPLQIDPTALDAWASEIEAVIGQLAKMGVRMLAKEMDESGVAIELRNAGQTSQLAALSRAISQMLQRIFTFMAAWRYGSEVGTVKASLSPDLTSSGLGADEMRLVTEWYMAGAVKRETWISMAKANDFLPADYDDSDAAEKITADAVLQAILDREKEMKMSTASAGAVPGRAEDRGGQGDPGATER